MNEDIDGYRPPPRTPPQELSAALLAPSDGRDFSGDSRDEIPAPKTIPNWFLETVLAAEHIVLTGDIDVAASA